MTRSRKRDQRGVALDECEKKEDLQPSLTDRPLANGSPDHGVTTAAPNVTQIVVQGETASEWLRLHINPRSPAVFSWQREQL